MSAACAACAVFNTTVITAGFRQHSAHLTCYKIVGSFMFGRVHSHCVHAYCRYTYTAVEYSRSVYTVLVL